MRPILIALCLLSAACSGEGLSSPTSPTSTGAGPAQSQAQGGKELPFRGSYTSVIEVPPPSAVGTIEGTATHLGRFTGRLTAEVTGNTATGTFTFTAANGDQLFGTYEGQFLPLEPPLAAIDGAFTNTGGTGRFEGVTGGGDASGVQNFATGEATVVLDGTISSVGSNKQGS